MIKKKKILSLLLLCLFISIFNVSKVNAGIFTGGTTIASGIAGNGNGGTGGDGNGGGNGNGNGNGNQGNNNNNGNWSSLKDGNKKIEYQYSSSVNGGTSYNILYASPYDIIKSGTWMGINIHEVQTASWSVSNFQAREVKKYYTCMKETRECGWEKELGLKPNRKWGYTDVWRCRTKLETVVNYEEHEYFDGYSCPPGTTQYVSEKKIGIDPPPSVINTAISTVRGIARGMVGAPLSKVQITTDDLNEKNEYKTLLLYAKLDYSIDEVYGWSGKVEKAYIYKPDNICMNLKTGKVSYNKECTKEEEVQLTPYIYDGVSYWQYFSQLDMKSGSNFNLVIKNNAERQYSGNECHSIMDNYKSEYQNYITSLSDKKLKGDYCKNGSCSNLNKGSGSDWQEVSKGCYLSTIISYNVVQKYYYEEMKNKQLTFNGYNIYYRSINIDNPFPNTPTENSLWYDWYNSTNKNPNLKDSFKEMTYSVAVSNKLADTIRAYNVNNPYPSFDKLSLAGESEFLRSIGVNSLTNDKYYKLGGGTKTCIKDKKVSIGSDCS